jgi:hypothetical protein
MTSVEWIEANGEHRLGDDLGRSLDFDTRSRNCAQRTSSVSAIRLGKSGSGIIARLHTHRLCESRRLSSKHGDWVFMPVRCRKASSGSAPATCHSSRTPVPFLIRIERKAAEGLCPFSDALKSACEFDIATFSSASYSRLSGGSLVRHGGNLGDIADQRNKKRGRRYVYFRVYPASLCYRVA